jgi:hypothetical protein
MTPKREGRTNNPCLTCVLTGSEQPHITPGIAGFRLNTSKSPNCQHTLCGCIVTVSRWKLQTGDHLIMIAVAIVTQPMPLDLP